MLILALDTTTRAGSAALARDGVVVRQIASDAAVPHASRLPSDLIMVLEEAGVPLEAVDVFAVATGPGSFTGLRIGIATMQGLAFAEGKPLLGVSALDALWRVGHSSPDTAESQHPGGHLRIERFATWIDAWRGEVYAALYDRERELAAPVVGSPVELLASLAHVPTLFIGDGAAAYRADIVQTLGGSAHIAHPAAPILAGVIARMAFDSARAGHRPPPHAIRPLYVRRPDAELARHVRAPR